MKAAFLIRCSTKKQDYNRQVKDLSRLADRMGYSYDASTIYGEHITGKDDATKQDRASIRHLKEDAEAGKFDVVLVAEVSRLSRDPMSGRFYVRELINMNIPVYFRDVDKWTIDPATGKKVPNAETEIGANFDGAWKYLKSLKTQIASGRRDELDNNCMSIGQPFFGYKRFGGRDKTKKNSWVIDEDAKEVVIEVFNRYLQDDATLKSVALSITKDYGDKFGKKFSLGSIEHILTFEPYYTGIKIVSLRDPDADEVEQFEVQIPAIITETTYKNAENKRKTNRVKSDPYPMQVERTLSKLVKCPCCGHSLTPRKRAGDGAGQKYRMTNGKLGISWFCMSRINNMADCTATVSINNEKLEPIIWELVKKELISFANLNTEDRLQKVEEYKQKIANVEADMANYKEQKESLAKKVNRAYQAYIDAPDEIVEDAKNMYLQTQASCKKEMLECQSKIEGFQQKKETYLMYKKALEQPEVPDDAIKKAEADPKEKRRLVKELIEKIVPYSVSTYQVKERYGTGMRTLKHGVLLIEVYAICGTYNILFNGNQRGKEQYAYYIGGNFATYQKGLRKFDAYEEGEYFVISNASLVMNTDDVDECVTMNEFQDIAEENQWVLSFEYNCKKK